MLDDLLRQTDYAVAIPEAQRDLPDDIWRDKPWRLNVTRDAREHQLATKMLASIRPKLMAMSVTGLVRALKVLPRYAFESFPGVSYYVFRDGNAMILAEIQSRPIGERRGLVRLSDEQVVVWEGDQGPGDTLADVINNRLLNGR